MNFDDDHLDVNLVPGYWLQNCMKQILWIEMQENMEIKTN